MQSIFLPAGGNYDPHLDQAGFWGYYWSSSLNSNTYFAFGIEFNSGSIIIVLAANRYEGMPIRPVKMIDQHEAAPDIQGDDDFRPVIFYPNSKPELCLTIARVQTEVRYIYFDISYI